MTLSLSLRPALPAAALGVLLLLGTALVAHADGDATVRVAPGDTLSSISLAHYGDVAHIRAIAAYNHLKDSDKIVAGQTLKLPPKLPTAATGTGMAQQAAEAPGSQAGVATWYGPGFEGKTTKCGQVYRQAGYSGASNDLPCDTVVEVTNLKNGRSVTVPVTDTGAFRHPNVMDLSRGAFAALADTKLGVIPVRLVVRAWPHASARAHEDKKSP